MGKVENAGYQRFLLFPQCFLPIPKKISVFKLHFVICKCFEFGPVYKFVIWKRVNPLRINNIPTTLRKTNVTTNFSFSHNVHLI